MLCITGTVLEINETDFPWTREHWVPSAVTNKIFESSAEHWIFQPCHSIEISIQYQCFVDGSVFGNVPRPNLFNADDGAISFSMLVPGTETTMLQNDRPTILQCKVDLQMW